MSNIVDVISEQVVLRRFLWSRPVWRGSGRQAGLSVGPTAFQINGLAS